MAGDGRLVAILGAGPAGLAAACRAAESGARVVLIDDNPHLTVMDMRAKCRASKRSTATWGLWWSTTWS